MKKSDVYKNIEIYESGEFAVMAYDTERVDGKPYCDFYFSAPGLCYCDWKFVVGMPYEWEYNGTKISKTREQMLSDFKHCYLVDAIRSYFDEIELIEKAHEEELEEEDGENE